MYSLRRFLTTIGTYALRFCDEGIILPKMIIFKCFNLFWLTQVTKPSQHYTLRKTSLHFRVMIYDGPYNISSKMSHGNHYLNFHRKIERKGFVKGFLYFAVNYQIKNKLPLHEFLEFQFSRVTYQVGESRKIFIFLNFSWIKKQDGINRFSNFVWKTLANLFPWWNCQRSTDCQPE